MMLERDRPAQSECGIRACDTEASPPRLSCLSAPFPPPPTTCPQVLPLFIHKLSNEKVRIFLWLLRNLKLKIFDRKLAMGETTFRETLSSWPQTIYSFASASPVKTRLDDKDDEQLSLMESESKRPSLTSGRADDVVRFRLQFRIPQSLSITSGSQLAWLTLYFLSNLGLTLYNKLVLVRFPFPYTLTALHALCGSIGGYILMERGAFEPRHLSLQESIVLVAFSVLYTVNIAVSNLSLGLVTVPVRRDDALALLQTMSHSLHSFTKSCAQPPRSSS